MTHQMMTTIQSPVFGTSVVSQHELSRW